MAGLKKKCTAGGGSTDNRNSSFFDWRTLGVEAGICFNAIPDRCTFAAGRWDSKQALPQKRVRKARAPRVQDTAPAERPEEEVEQAASSSAKPKETPAEANIKVLRKTLSKRHDQEKVAHGEEATTTTSVPGVPFLLNPQSFTQTVENIFYYSFLVKKGEAGIAASSQDGLRVRPAVAEEGQPVKQAICSLTMRDWRRLCEQHLGNQSGDLPHRRMRNSTPSSSQASA